MDERVIRKGCLAAQHCARGTKAMGHLKPRENGVVNCVFIEFLRLCDVGTTRYRVAVILLPLGVTVTVVALLLLLVIGAQMRDIFAPSN